MDRKQWYVLAIVTFLFGVLFIKLDINKGSLSSSTNICDYEEKLYYGGKITFEQYTSMSDAPLDELDVYCLVRGEIYAPFVYLFNFLWIVFLILAGLESKKH